MLTFCPMAKTLWPKLMKKENPQQGLNWEVRLGILQRYYVRKITMGIECPETPNNLKKQMINANYIISVSYTHLTLPTIYSV